MEDFPRLAEEIRSFLIQSVSETGGHLASNLGVVELTLDLHNVLDLPQDKLIWDVGHQAYTYDILTGRKDGFKDLRKEGGCGTSGLDSFDTHKISAGRLCPCQRRKDRRQADGFSINNAAEEV